jgi:hypothetical protein
MDPIEVEVDPRRLSIDPRRLSGIDKDAVLIHIFPPAAAQASRRESMYQKPPTIDEKPPSDLADELERDNVSKRSIQIPPLRPLVVDEWDGGWDAWSSVAGG